MPVLIQFFFMISIFVLVPFLGLLKTLLIGAVFVGIYIFLMTRN